MSDSADIRYIGFNKYTKQPIKENTYKNYVMNGKNNENYKFIIDMYNGSTTNKAINNAYVDLAYGRGLAIHDDDENETKLKELLEYFPKLQHKPVLVDNQILGELSFQVHRQRGNKNALAKIEHISKSNVIPSVEDDEGNIRSYWYSADWNKQYQSKYKPKEYPAFGYAEDFDYERPEIYVGRPYVIGTEYFSTPDYDACLQYASIEQEISNYYDSHIKNGMSFGTIINVPNSKHWDDPTKQEYLDSLKANTQGSSNAGKVVVAFLTGNEPTTITNVENNNAHKQWDFLTKEASSKIISGHKCMSPMLVGLGSASGFSSKADEMDMMEQQLMKRVIAPKQDFFIDNLKTIFEYFNLEFDCYLRPLTEIEGEKEEEEKVDETDAIEEVEMSKKKSEFDFLEQYAEDEPKDYELHRIDYDITEPLQLRADANSEQDTKLWKVRYAYNIGTSKTPIGDSRSFCNKMMRLSQNGKVFRKEDIEKMSDDGVNGQFAHSGGKYDIFLYAGGVNCYHRWERRIYKKKRDKEDKPLGGNALQNTFPVSVSEARRQGFRPEKNSPDVAIAEIDKPNKGAYPS